MTTRRAETLTAATGGALALAAAVLLPFHLGGGYGTAIAVGFLAAGILLALASVGLGHRLARDGERRWITSWAALGAAGFFVSGTALVGDVIERPFVAGEVLAVVAVAAWWGAVWRRFARADRAPWFRGFTLLCAVSAAAAIVGQTVWEPPAGAVPARFAYVLWGPWGLWLARVLAREPAR